MADSVLKNAGELKGNIALVSRDTEQVERARGMISFSEKVTRAAEAGAVGVIFVDTKDHLQRIEGDQGYKCKIPVLMINSSDSSLLRERGSALIRDQGTSERNATKPHALHEGLHERFRPQLIWGTHTRSPNWYR